MTILNTIQIPSFENFAEVTDFVHAHSDKLFLHFIQDDGKIQHNAILSKIESQNNEFNQLDVYHCMGCEAINDTIQQEEFCPECHPHQDYD